MTENPLQITLEQGSYKLKFSTLEFGKAIYDSLFDLADFKAGSFVKKIIGAVKLEKNESVIAANLVFYPLMSAMYNLVKEEFAYFKKLSDKKQLDFNAYDLKEQIIIIDDKFFKNPAKLPMIEFAQEIFKDTLIEISYSSAEAKKLAKLLPDRYLIELIKEWNKNEEKYKPILQKFVDNPFYAEWKKRQNILEYYSNLKADYYAPAMGDKRINLNDVYIHQNFKIYKDCFPKDYELKNEDEDKDGFYYANNITKIHDFVNNYFLNNKKNIGLDAEKNGLMLLLGQPGQGKTSFCSKTAYSLLNNSDFSDNFYIIRLKDIPNPSKFIEQPIDEIFDYLSKYKKVNFEANDTVLLLDGLDELYMSAGLNKSDMKQMFEMLQKEISNRNNLRIIITSRYNYVDIDSLSHKKTLIFRLDELTLEQQINWLKKYKSEYKLKSECKLTEKKLKEINSEENKQYKAIKELVSQPILLYIIARANFEIDENFNRAAIYDKLFEALTKREWSKDGQLTKFEKINADELREYLSLIALKIYQSNNEYITRSELMELEETKEFLENNGLSNKDLGNGLKEILVNFYFQNVEKHKDDNDRNDKNEFAIEFLHKSLQEYLAAECVYNKFKDEFTNQTIKNSRKKYNISSWKDALKLSWNIFSKKRISDELREYIIEIINNDKDEEIRKELSERMSYFFDDLLQKQFIWKYNAETGGNYPIEKSVTTFYGYWLIMAELILKNNYITEENKDDFSKILKSCFGAWYYQFNFSYQNLTNISLHFVMLALSSFTDAELSNTDFRGAELGGADFHKANFTKADLSRADLSGANFHRANLSKADLSRADLSGADFRGADLRGANLRGADLRGSDLRRADLRGVNLSEIIINKNTFFSYTKGLSKNDIKKLKRKI